MNYGEKIYQFNEYVLSYDKGEKERSCLIIGKCLLDKLYVMAELYDGSAEIISTILDSLQQENKQLRDKIPYIIQNNLCKYISIEKCKNKVCVNYEMQELEGSDSNVKD